MKKTLLCLACLVILAIGARPAAAMDTTWDPGTMPYGLDARAFGMGGACLAVVDPWSMPANPAGLTYLTTQGIYVGRFVNPPFDTSIGMGDQTDIFVTYAHPAEGDIGAYALTLYSNSYDNIYAFSGGTHMATEFIGINYSYAYAFNDRLSAGFSIRWLTITDTVDGNEYDVKLFTADVGAVYRIGKNVIASVMITDLLAPETDYDEIDTRILFGGSFRIGQFFLLAVDVDYNIDSEVDLDDMTRYGLEFRPLKFLAIRAGSYHGDLTWGFGFTLGGGDDIELCLDFGQRWEDNGELVSEVQCMQMTVHF